MKHVKVEELVSAVPLAPPLNDRKQKLSYLAKLVREANHHMRLFHNLEYVRRDELDKCLAGNATDSIFALALSNPHLRAAGVGDTIGAQMNFFEISQKELHEFSCDCGGHIDNQSMANRIEGLSKHGKDAGIIRRSISRLFG